MWSCCFRGQEGLKHPLVQSHFAPFPYFHVYHAQQKKAERLLLGRPSNSLGGELCGVARPGDGVCFIEVANGTVVQRERLVVNREGGIGKGRVGGRKEGHPLSIRPNWAGDGLLIIL